MRIIIRWRRTTAGAGALGGALAGALGGELFGGELFTAGGPSSARSASTLMQLVQRHIEYRLSLYTFNTVSCINTNNLAHLHLNRSLTTNKNTYTHFDTAACGGDTDDALLGGGVTRSPALQASHLMELVQLVQQLWPCQRL